MESKAIYFRVGIVVLSGLAILGALIVWVGSEAFRAAGRPFETYFAESVQGLEVGAGVRFRGVPIGRVTAISMAAAEYGASATMQVLANPAYQFVVVRFEVFTDRIAAREIGEMRRMVESGLRVRMASQGITGVLYLEVDFLDPARFVPLDVPWEPRFVHIPSVPSTLTQITVAAERILGRLEQADLPALVDNANALVGALAESVTTGEVFRILVEAGDLLGALRSEVGTLSPDVEGTVAEAKAAITALRRVIEGREMQTTMTGVAGASARLPQTAAAIEQAARRLDATVADANRDLGPMLRDLRITADNLKALTEQMRQFPSQVLFGAPPPREPEPAARGAGR
jgi:ABC-type transporter Mla subunit MlaD